MQNPAFNPMHPGNFRFQDEESANAADRIAAAQDGLLNEALAIGHAPSIAAALGLVARMRGMSELAAATGIRRPESLSRARAGRQSDARHAVQGDQRARLSSLRRAGRGSKRGY